MGNQHFAPRSSGSIFDLGVVKMQLLAGAQIRTAASRRPSGTVQRDHGRFRTFTGKRRSRSTS